MEQKDLFEVFKDDFQSYEIPYDERDWEDLEKKLEEARPKKKGFIIVLRKLYMPLAMAAGIILLAGIFRIPFNDRGSKADNTAAVLPGMPPATIRPEVPDQAPATVLPNPPFAAREQPSPTARIQREQLFPRDTAQYTMVSADTATAVVNDPPPVNHPQQPKAASRRDWAFHPDIAPPAVAAGLRIAATGGLNYNDQMGYAIGAAFSKNLSKRLALQADVAFINNNIGFSYDRMDITERQVIGIGGVYTEYDTTIQNTSGKFRHNYAQVAFSFDLRLQERSHVSLGVDLQRLVNNDVPDRVAPGGSFPKLAPWNSGLIMRYRYSLNPKLGIGLTYRQDLTSALQNALQNNNLQINLSYSLKSK
jgi:hypothetical protein